MLHRYSNTPFIPATILQCQRATYVVPAFTYPVTWLGVAGLLKRYPINNTGAIALALPILPPTGDFIFAVYWISNSVSYRMKLWDAVSSLGWPVYNGASIAASAFLEVWSSANVANAVLASAFTLSSSAIVELDDPTDSTPALQPSETITLVPES